MKASELRIGNLVYGINRRSEVHLPNETPLKVWQIEIFNCEVLPPDKNPAEAESYLKISNVDITGIPLTEDWLLKFGWVWNAECNSYEKYPNGDVRMNLAHKDYGYDMFNYVIKAMICKRIVFVHQLQNLYYALTGEELIIKSFEGGQEKLKEKNNVA